MLLSIDVEVIEFETTAGAAALILFKCPNCPTEEVIPLFSSGKLPDASKLWWTMFFSNYGHMPKRYTTRAVCIKGVQYKKNYAVPMSSKVSNQ